MSDPDLEVGPELSTEDRIVLVAATHPIAQRSSVTYEELAEYPMPGVDFVSREVMDAFIPPRTPSGRIVQRAPVHSITESLMQVAAGKLVHPTVRSYAEYYRHPAIVAVPIDDLPPSRTALVWLERNTTAALEAFVNAATDVLRQASTPSGPPEPAGPGSPGHTRASAPQAPSILDPKRTKSRDRSR